MLKKGSRNKVALLKTKLVRAPLCPSTDEWGTVDGGWVRDGTGGELDVVGATTDDEGDYK
jgi:hypothetical protein